MIANLLQCDVMLLIMQTVLEKSLDLKERTFSEGHLQKVFLGRGGFLCCLSVRMVFFFVLL